MEALNLLPFFYFYPKIIKFGKEFEFKITLKQYFCAPMSNFSEEFVQYQGIKIDYQFSYFELFENLGINQSIYQVCDGFEAIGIKNLNGIPFLVKANGMEINLQKLLAESSN
jgi:hypothetical protein